MSKRVRFQIVVSLFVVSACASGVAPGQTVWYVDQSVSAGGNGLAWSTAFNDLQDALASATTGDDIWVAAGTYLPSHLPFALRTATFDLVDGVAVYGGFPPGGGDGTFSARDITDPANQTILSGDIGLQGDASDNTYHVVTALAVGDVTVLDGFIVTNGNADGDSALEYDIGGGLYSVGGALTVRRSVFTSNTALSGGGMCISSSSGAHVTQCSFAGNAALSTNLSDGGGGIYNVSSSPLVSDCVFVNNSGLYGGGICNDSNSSPTITRCGFTDNVAASRGGGIASAGGYVSITQCEFNGNTAPSGGGIFSEGGSTNVDDCTFLANAAQGSAFSQGGGIYKINGNLTVANSRFVGNVSSGRGGGLNNSVGYGTTTNCIFIGNTAVHGGGMALVANGVPTVRCQFIGNAASENGGGIYGSAQVAESLFVLNSAGDKGGGCYGPGSQSVGSITACSFNGNSASTVGGAICAAAGSLSSRNSILWGDAATGGAEVAVLAGAELDIAYSDVEGGVDAVYGEPGSSVSWSTSVINSDPLFVNPRGPDGVGGTEDDNLRIVLGSPCIDAGKNAYVDPYALDLDRNDRRFDDPATADCPQGGCGDPPIVDMGAYEFGAPSADCNGNGVHDAIDPDICRGDTNCDGQVDFGDVNPFVSALLNGTYCDGTGFNVDCSRDCSVSFDDINPFVELLTTSALPIPCP